MVRGKGLVEGMRDWQKYYGDVYTIWIGPMATVNICEYQLAQEAMVKKGNNFANRPYLYLLWVIRGSLGGKFERKMGISRGKRCNCLERSALDGAETVLASHPEKFRTGKKSDGGQNHAGSRLQVGVFYAFLETYNVLLRV